jgi:hypothetical protein
MRSSLTFEKFKKKNVKNGRDETKSKKHKVDRSARNKRREWIDS